MESLLSCHIYIYILNMAPTPRWLLGGSRPGFRDPLSLSLGITHGLKYKFTRIVLKLECYMMAKKWVEARRTSELVDGVEP